MLECNGRVMEEADSIADYNVVDNSIVRVLAKPSGRGAGAQSSGGVRDRVHSGYVPSVSVPPPFPPPPHTHTHSHSLCSDLRSMGTVRVFVVEQDGPGLDVSDATTSTSCFRCDGVCFFAFH